MENRITRYNAISLHNLYDVEKGIGSDRMSMRYPVLHPVYHVHPDKIHAKIWKLLKSHRDTEKEEEELRIKLFI